MVISPYCRHVPVRDRFLDIRHVGPVTALRAPARPTRRNAVAGSVAGSLAARLFIALVVLNAVDLLTTHLVLGRGGAEANPFLSPIIDNVVGAVGVKALCLLAIGGLIMRSRRSSRMLAVVAAVDLWYVIVIAWNVRVLVALG